MKRYLIPILVAVLVLTSGLLVTCGQKSEPIPFPDKPLRSEKEMTYALYDYFFEEFGFSTYWARPRFFVDEKWSASYNGEGMWLVKAYDVGIDGSYVGAWLVPEGAYYGEDYETVEPFDDDAKRVASGVRRIAEMPPRPAFLRLSNSPREDMITAVQQHIARMSRQEAEDAFVTEIQRAVEAYYPLEWYVSYTDSVWLLVADYYEYRARVFIDPHTSQITVSGGFAPPGF